MRNNADQMNQLLVIEDEALVRETIIQSLSKDGYDILVAENGREGLDIFNKEQPQVVILDLKMPVMDGIEFLRQLPPQAIQSHHIIVLTGYGNHQDAAACYQLGIQSFLRKPFENLELQGTVKRSFELVRNNAAIQQLNTRLTSILHNLPDLIWECDNALCFTYVSNNAEQILGYSSASLLGKPISHYLSQEVIIEFFYKFNKNFNELIDEIHTVPLTFIHQTGKPILMQVSAKSIFNDQGMVVGLAGINRDISHLSGLEKFVEEMLIRIDPQLRLVYADPAVQELFADDPQTRDEPLDFTQFLADSSSEPILSFGFDQKEDLPFPLEIKLMDSSGTVHYFEIQLQFQEEGPFLEGQLIPADLSEQIELVTEKVEAQAETLESAVLIDPEMREDILIDSRNLAQEILGLVKLLTPFEYPSKELFILDEFKMFIQDKNIATYQENLQFLGNKIHGLKGSSGFLIPDAKHICHRIEDLTLPLTALKIVYRPSISKILKEFVFEILEMLDKYEEDPSITFTSIDVWIEKIDHALAEENAYIGASVNQFNELLIERNKDTGEVRNRKREFISVSSDGYDRLFDYTETLYIMVSGKFTGDELVQITTLYDNFKDEHQDAKKTLVNLSRYERLIPSIAKEYGKEVEFIYEDHSIRVEQDFLNALHEILNHCLKNAVIHGIEQPKERQLLGKDSTGKIEVKVQEDPTHIFVTVTDDGKGLSAVRIAEKAIEQKIVSEEQVASMSQSEIFALMFIQGVTTVEEVDDNAGRGVGMNAVKEAMEEFQGSCEIDSKEGRGTSLTFSFAKPGPSPDLSAF